MTPKTPSTVPQSPPPVPSRSDGSEEPMRPPLPRSGAEAGERRPGDATRSEPDRGGDQTGCGCPEE